jgi:antitoxin (DNA-binding transcriptional repressor) of toxin-antitoxin stability system
MKWTACPGPAINTAGMKAIEVSSQTTSLKDLVRLAQEGKEVVLTDQNEPVAKVVAIPTSNRSPAAQTRRKLGLHREAWQVSEDFDEPLPEEFWLGRQ